MRPLLWAVAALLLLAGWLPVLGLVVLIRTVWP
jgi:hypothetical protein